MTLNARVEMSPESLENIVRKVLKETTAEGISFRIASMEVPQSRPAKSYLQVQQNCMTPKYLQTDVDIASFRKGSLLSIMFE